MCGVGDILYNLMSCLYCTCDVGDILYNLMSCLYCTRGVLYWSVLYVWCG